MRILVAVYIDRLLIAWLRADGHEILWLAENAAEQRLQDLPLMALAYRENAIIFTSDREFVGHVFRDRIATHGVVLLRVPIVRRPHATLIQLAYEATSTHQALLRGNFTTIYPDSIETTPLS